MAKGFWGKYVGYLSHVTIVSCFLFACKAESVVTPGICQGEACCTNQVQDPGEQGVDCGGICSSACPSCFDGIQNQDETGVDCGGNCSASCPSCSDGIRNQDELGIDCGGVCVNSCESCTDGIQNQDETGVDCGGVCTSTCDSCSDGIRNQGELGIDCGGSCPNACPSPAYQRSNLRPLYENTPFELFSRFIHIDGDNNNNLLVFSNADFQTIGGARVSQRQKLTDIEIDGVLGPISGQPSDLIVTENDERLAGRIQFRGKPSDVKFVNTSSQTKVYVPLGGNIQTPGNEVAIVTLDQTGTQLGEVERITVGLRPQRLAVHPAGLVFVCNQYSNYITVIDVKTDELLVFQNKEVEIPVDFYCSDIVFARRSIQSNDIDSLLMYVSNRWKHTVDKYLVDVTRRGLTGDVENVVAQRLAEISGIGPNPYRLSVNETQTTILAVSNKGGHISSIDIQSNQSKTIQTNAPTADVVNIGTKLFVSTTMRDRGHMTQVSNTSIPSELLAVGPGVVTGVDQNQHTVHPGNLVDETASYQFEDIGNGIFELDLALAERPFYYTDDSSGEPNFTANQKIVGGGLPWGMTRNTAGTEIWVTLSGSQEVQQFIVNSTAQIGTSLSAGRVLNTGHRPLGVALDEPNNRLYVANYMGETLDIFDLSNNSPEPFLSVDLGYGDPVFPASRIEIGELFFNDTTFSNDGDKSCASCHFDELDTDGLGFSTGTQAATGIKQVKPNHNVARTGPWLWNGGMGNETYASMALAFQTRPNCEVIHFGLVEGPDSDPLARAGDSNNFTNNINVDSSDPDFANLDDTLCQPQAPVELGIAANNEQFIAQNTIQKRIVNRLIQTNSLRIMGQGPATALGFSQGVSRPQLTAFIDWYSAAELRLPPNPIRQMYNNNMLSASVVQKLQEGERIFNDVARCNRCHIPSNSFADGLNHGRGADWLDDFVEQYEVDQRVTSQLPNGVFSDNFGQALNKDNSISREVNYHLEPVDSFASYCPVVTSCLIFEDPLGARSNVDEETRRLDIQLLNLIDPERSFIPGYPPDLPSVNTASLRGVWTSVSLLRHAQATSIREVILPPGHTALLPGETGYNVDYEGTMNVHGLTRNLTSQQVEALVLYVSSIE